MESTTLRLYQTEGCPFCQLVRKKLTMLQVSALMIPVAPIGDDRKELIKLSDQKAVPVLQDKHGVIVGSSSIIEYLDKQFGDGSNPPLPANDYGVRKELKGTLQQAQQKTIAVFREQGFVLLTQIDINKRMNAGVAIGVEPNLIFGFSHPLLTHQLMELEPDIELLLPFNVIVKETPDGTCLITAVNPVKMLSVVGRNDLMALTMAVRKLFSKALESIN